MDKYIDREAFERRCMFDPDIQDMQDVIYALRDYPAADVKPVVRGRWIVHGQDIFCSICNNESGYSPFGASAFSDFCPSCGADMRRKEEVSEE